MARKFLVLLTVVALVVTALPTFAQDGIESVCLVTDIGRINDGTFNQYAYEGMLAAAAEFELETNFIETTNQTDYEANLNSCIDEGYDVVITVGFLIADASAAAAAANPDTFIIGVDQFVADGPANYAGIQFREDQAGFLVGVLAALVSESETVGGVYGIDIPPVVKFRHGYERGIALYNEQTESEVTALGVYIDDFNAGDRGASAAEQFIGDGADVIFGAGGPTGSGGILAAAQQGVYVIGVDQDEYYTTFGEGETEGAEYLISSAQKAVDVGVYDLIAALAGESDLEFPGGSVYVLDVANGGITFSPAHDSDIEECVYETVQSVADALADGSLETGVDAATGELIEDAEFGDFELVDACE